MTDALSWRNKSTLLRLSAIMAVAVVFRLALLSLVHNPGLHDPLHYFNLGRRLSQGQGFTIDYVWHYSRMPVELVHDTDHWMPLAGVAAAVGLTVGGGSIQSALALFLLAGASIPLLVFLAAKQLEQGNSCALVAALFSAVLPDLVLNSLRTDTAILNAALVTGAILLINRAMLSELRLPFVFSGLLFGLAYLTRSDSIIFFPMVILYVPLARAFGAKRHLRTGIPLVVGCLADRSVALAAAKLAGSRHVRQSGN